MIACVMHGDEGDASGAGAPPAGGAMARRSGLRWLLVPAAALFALALVEACLRMFLPQAPSWLAIHAAHPRIPTFALAPEQHTVIETGESRWVVHTDAAGHRIDPTHVDAPGEPVVLWLGDSFTFGYGVDCGETFVGRLAREPSDRARHVNAAIGGHGPREYALVLEDLLAQGLRPTAVMACVYVGNDFQDVLWEKPPVVQDGIIGNTGGLRSLLKVHLHTYRLASKAWQRLATELEAGEAWAQTLLQQPDAWLQGDLAEATRRVREALARLQADCSRQGCPLHVVVLPHKAAVAAVRAHGEAGSAEPDDGRLPVVRLCRILGELGIPFTDVTGALAEHPIEASYFRIDTHLRPFGHEVVAQRLRETVRSIRS